ncbi:ATP-dependent RNA helicase RhlE [Halioglobus japonicus]|nr:ATP-dependent RNA helicase RhlE [Halioglobus japonicus]
MNSQPRRYPMTFEQLGLSEPLLRAIAEKGYREPSPIQAAAIPAILSGRDLMAAAQTGTGKTAAFILPILQRLRQNTAADTRQVRVLVLTPTRELAIQVAENTAIYGAYLPFTSNVVYGGVKIDPQMAAMRKGADILVATPGRLLDLCQRQALELSALEVLVLDEADRMLNLGFINDIRRILKLLPPQRQNLMFSATFSSEIRALAKTILHKPLEVSVSPENAAAQSVEQWLHPVDKKRKSDLLLELIAQNDWQHVLVFTRTKAGADRIAQYLVSAGVHALAMHSDKTQGARSRALAGFKHGKVRVLVATDVAARGLDIEQLPQVVNFDLPNVPEDYVHRIGRTGRAGSTGHAYSLVCADEIKQLNAIEQMIQRHITREYIGGFEPDHEVPGSAPLRNKRASGRPPARKASGPRWAGRNTRPPAARKRGGEGHKRSRRNGGGAGRSGQ